MEKRILGNFKKREAVSATSQLKLKNTLSGNVSHFNYLVKLENVRRTTDAVQRQ